MLRIYYGKKLAHISIYSKSYCQEIIYFLKIKNFQDRKTKVPIIDFPVV